MNNQNEVLTIINNETYLITTKVARPWQPYQVTMSKRSGPFSWYDIPLEFSSMDEALLYLKGAV